ncbi:MAG: peptidoglycan-binding protein [Leptolyngbya sp. Prado105]|jgi:peptidoglycan hydrolase-like protein with peptidoglycan-binding domain|nr:peptidoglycan-binding protein [Leptolyngbya sp. Prado105]
METIANLHLACENESLDRTQNKLVRSGKIGIRVLSLLMGCVIVGFANSAIAQSILRRDSEGSDVIELQNRLQELRCYDGSITGFFGEQTEAAVIRCQQQAGIRADGVVGPETYRALGLSGGTTVNPGDDFSQPGTRLQLGDRGRGVQELQTQLRRRGYYNGEIDGIFGSSTEAAVIRLQQDINRTPTGVADAAVYAALGQSTRPERAILTVGDENNRVTQLQRQLSQLGYSVPITGYYGSQTENAVRRFQSANFLPPTGTGDERTLRQIREASGATGEDGSVSFNPRNTLRYRVIVPIPNPTDLGRVTRIAPNAVPKSSRLGNYAQVASYATPEEAERAAANLRSRGLADARVIFD